MFSGSGFFPWIWAHRLFFHVFFFWKFRQSRRENEVKRGWFAIQCMCIKTALIFATVVESSPPKQESHRYVLVQLRRKRTELAKFEKESGDVRRRSRFDFLLLFPCNLWLCWFLYQGLNGLKIFHCNIPPSLQSFVSIS